MMNLQWRDFDKFSDMFHPYLPDMGEGETMATQIATAVNKLVYKWFNDGDVYDNTYYLSGWVNDLSSYANWLETCTNAGRILADISTCTTEDDYTELLYKLCMSFTHELLKDYNTLHKVGSVYDCDGSFRYEERYGDEEDY